MPTITLTGGGYTTKATAVLQTFTFMNPTDNPKRPRHRFWFGPMTMIQYMSDTGIFPGVTTDVSMLPAKLGIQGALTDIQNNHPNDMVSMLMFSRPHYSGEPTDAGTVHLSGDQSQPQLHGHDQFAVVSRPTAALPT